MTCKQCGRHILRECQHTPCQSSYDNGFCSFICEDLYNEEKDYVKERTEKTA